MRKKSGSMNNQVVKQYLNCLGFQNNKKENGQDQNQVKTQNLLNNIGTCTNSNGIVCTAVVKELIDGAQNLEIEQIIEGLQWVKNTLNLEDIQNTITIKKILPNKSQKKQIIIRFIRRTGYVALGGGIVFFVGNLILGNGFLPAISVAASGVFQKQKQKVGESILNETPELVTKNFHFIKENLQSVPTQQIPFLPSPDSLTVQKQIPKLKNFVTQPAKDLQKGLINSQKLNAHEIFEQSKHVQLSTLSKHKLHQFYYQNSNQILRGGNNVSELFTAIAATFGIGKGIWKLFGGKKNENNNKVKIDSDNLNASTNSTRNTAIVAKSKEDVVTDKSNIIEPVPQQTFMGIAITIWSHMINNYKTYAFFIFLISLVIITWQDIQRIEKGEKSLVDIIKSTIKKLKKSIKKKEIPRWLEDIRRNKEELKKMYDDWQIDVQKQNISFDYSEDNSQSLPAETIKEVDEIYDPYRDLWMDQEPAPDLAYVDKSEKRYSNVFLPKDILPNEFNPDNVFPDEDL